MPIDSAIPAPQAAGMLHVVKLCYQHAFLSGRKQAGLSLSEAEEARLTLLAKLLEIETAPSQRGFRRLPVILPVSVKAARQLRRGTMLNISAGGMFISTQEPLPTGTSVQVQLGQPGEVLFTFPAVVRWSSRSGKGAGMGLSFTGIPLEVRYGAYHTPRTLPLAAEG